VNVHVSPLVHRLFYSNQSTEAKTQRCLLCQCDGATFPDPHSCIFMLQPAFSGTMESSPSEETRFRTPGFESRRARLVFAQFLKRIRRASPKNLSESKPRLHLRFNF
jgi:hypothetical protein